MTRRLAAALILAIAPAGCGPRTPIAAPAPSDHLEAGTPAVVVASKAEVFVDVLCQCEGEGQDVVVLVPGRDGFLHIQDGTKATILEDKGHDPAENYRTIRVRLDSGEHEGKVLRMARVFLVGIKSR